MGLGLVAVGVGVGVRVRRAVVAVALSTAVVGRSHIRVERLGGVTEGPAQHLLVEVGGIGGGEAEQLELRHTVREARGALPRLRWG